ncbi:MAG: helicase-associated domain-containing protein [Chloroflexi bacterium]|nr:helicase-associated domain-containing protein [Chloroflexota bacterium]MBP7045310.1 helicase-associated domain-containing protein [Chloroflexota bacterium]
MAYAAKLPGTVGKKLKKADLLQLMQAEFFKPERISASYQRLTKTERAVVDRLMLRGSTSSTRLFARELVRAGLAKEAPPPKSQKENRPYYPSGPSIYGRSVAHIGSINDLQSPVFEDVMARLTLYGLVFSEGTTGNNSNLTYKLQFHPGETVYIPPFVRRHLPDPDPLPIVVNAWQPVHILHGDAQLFLRDLYLYWDTVRRSPISLIQSGFVGKRGLKMLNAALLNPDPALDKARQEDEASRLYLLRQILQELKLVTPKGALLQTSTKNRSDIPDFWQKTTAEQVTAVIAIWRNLSSCFQFNDRRVGYMYEPNVRQGCQVLLKALASVSANTWIEADDLLIFVQDLHKDFLFDLRSRITGNRNYYYYGDITKVTAEMDKLEKAFVSQVVADFLFQMGLVELGFSGPPTEPTNWRVCRLTLLGTAVLGNKPLPANEPAGQIIIQPNFQILAMGPVSLHLLAELDIFAERQKVDRGAFEYHLSRESLYAAQQAGYAVAQVRQFLDEATLHDLPQNIHRSLAEWAAHHDRIVFRRSVTLLQAADETLLAHLLDDDETGKLLARPVGQTVALVKTKQQIRLLSALQSSGLFPVVSGASPEAADKSVVVAEDGRIQPLHAVPSLHLRGRLARFAVETDGGWQLTGQSVRHAGGSKKNAQSIIDELGKLNRGPLPNALVEQIRAWSGYYGRATIATMTLFEFRDQETLVELRALPELKDLLQPFAAGNRALARVDEKQVTAVQAILTRLGLEFKSGA